MRTWFYAATRDLLALKELGGWSSFKMVERYAHVNVNPYNRFFEEAIA